MSGVVHRGLESLGAVDERPPAVFLSESSTAQCLLGTRAPAVQFHWRVIIQGELPVSTLGIHSLNGRWSAGAPLCPKCRPKKERSVPLVIITSREGRSLSVFDSTTCSGSILRYELTWNWALDGRSGPHPRDLFSGGFLASQMIGANAMLGKVQTRLLFLRRDA